MNYDGVHGAAHSRFAVLLVLREGAGESVIQGQDGDTPSSVWALPQGSSPRRMGQHFCLKFQKPGLPTWSSGWGAQPRESPELGFPTPPPPTSLGMEKKPSLCEMWDTSLLFHQPQLLSPLEQGVLKHESRRTGPGQPGEQETRADSYCLGGGARWTSGALGWRGRASWKRGCSRQGGVLPSSQHMLTSGLCPARWLAWEVARPRELSS